MRAALRGGPVFFQDPTMAGTPLSIIVGLGNPGPEHRLTRHNAGFWLVDALARSQGVQFRSHARYQGEIARVNLEGREITLLKPQTYMNRSGLSVRALMDYTKAPVGEILVVHDELDLPPGVARLKFGGGHGGHNGLRDTITHCGPDFWRLRLGIGHPGDRDQVIDYVLQRAAPQDEEATVESLSASLDALPVFLRDGSEKAMKQLHTKGTV
jgi:PTH1 family peptidyl-tRNA hydrolase